MMPRKFTNMQLDEADRLHAAGEKWDVVDMLLGIGIKQACYYRSTRGYVGEYDEGAELRQALSAWNGEGDKSSYLAGWLTRAKRQREL